MELQEMHKRVAGELYGENQYEIAQVVNTKPYKLKYRVDTYNETLYIEVNQHTTANPFIIHAKDEFGRNVDYAQHQNLEVALNQFVKIVEEYFEE